jgi:hypothetical protein
MRPVEFLVMGVNAAVIVLLLRAAPPKLVAPSLTAAAVGELRSPRRPPPVSLIRSVAVLELATALAVAIPALRLPAQSTVALLGLLFLGAGTLGMVRGSRRPCGCFGAPSTTPLGIVNVLLGIAFLAAAWLNVAVRDLDGAGTMSTAAALSAVIASAGWLIVANRGRAATVIRNIRARSEASA